MLAVKSRGSRSFLSCRSLVRHVLYKQILRMMYHSVSGTGILRKKKIRVLLSGDEPKTFRLLVRMLYHVPLSYRRLVGAVKLTS